MSYARGRNRKPLPWRRHGICSFFMFITWTALFTDLTFGKGESQRENHFLSLDSLMSTSLLIYILYSLLLKQKEVMSQQLAKTKSKTDIRHPPMIGTHFSKIKRYLTKIFYRFLFRKLDIGCKTTKNFGYIPISPLSTTFKHGTICYVQFPCVLLGGNLIFLHGMEAHFNRS